MSDQIDDMKRKASRIVGDGVLMHLTIPSLAVNELVEVRGATPNGRLDLTKVLAEAVKRGGIKPMTMTLEVPKER